MNHKFILLSLMLLLQAGFLFSQKDRQEHIYLKVSSANLYGDIGYQGYIMDDYIYYKVKEFTERNGLSYGLGYYYNLQSRWRIGMETQFSHLAGIDEFDTPIFPAEDMKGYYNESNTLEFGVHLEYNILTVFENSYNPVHLFMGLMPNYLFSSGSVYYISNDDYVESNVYGFEAKKYIHAIILYPTLSISYQLNNFDFRLSFEGGFTPSDYLDHYTDKYSQAKDILGKIGVQIGYRIR